VRAKIAVLAKLRGPVHCSVNARDEGSKPITILVPRSNGAAGSPLCHGGCVEPGRTRAPAKRSGRLVEAPRRPLVPGSAVLDSRATGPRLIRSRS